MVLLSSDSLEYDMQPVSFLWYISIQLDEMKHAGTEPRSLRFLADKTFEWTKSITMLNTLATQLTKNLLISVRCS